MLLTSMTTPSKHRQKNIEDIFSTLWDLVDKDQAGPQLEEILRRAYDDGRASLLEVFDAQEALKSMYRT